MSLKIVRGVQRSPVRGVLHGTEGIGKTTLAAQFPNPLILDTEDGSGQIDCARVVCHEWAVLEGAIHELVRDSQGFQTVVIDSADWMERQIIDHVLKKAGKRSIEDFGFGKGYTIVGEAVARVLTSADQLIAAGMHVIFVAHSQVKRCSPPDETDGYDRYELKLTKQSAPLFKEWADLLLFCNYKTKLVEGADGRTKACGGKERVMYAERTAAWDAKNRFGLPAEMPMEISHLRRLWEPATAAASRKSLRERIAEASSVAELGELGDLVDDQASKGKLTPEQVATLEAAIAARHSQLEPEAVHG